MLFVVEMHSNSTHIKFLWSDYTATLGNSQFSMSVNISEDFSETTCPISIRFDMQPSGKRGKRVYIFGTGHVTKMAAMPIYAQNLQNTGLLDCLETWYVESADKVLYSIKFYGNVRFSPLCL